MTEERFESDVRAVLGRLAPDDVPIDFRERLRGVTAETGQRGPWLARRWRSALALAAAAVVIVAAIGLVILPRIVGSAGTPAPTSRVGSFVDQTDGKYGYEMLRPAAWTSIDFGLGQGRGYRDATTPADARVVLTVNNLAVAARSVVNQTGTIAQWEAFLKDSSLEGWTAGNEGIWRSNQMGYTLLETLSNAKIYTVRSPDGSALSLVAYVIDGGQPLAVALDGSAAASSLEPLDQLRADGTLADFLTMVKSLRAIPADPANVSPPLP